MQTVREQLVELAEAVFDTAYETIRKDVFAWNKLHNKALLARDRARAVAECPDRESICPDCGTECPCYQEGANEGHSLGCNDDSCSCWAAGYQAGTEAQREPAGRGTV